jgi:peroxiredoxin
VRHRITAIVLFTALSLATAAFGQEKKESEPLKMKVGDMAPDFTLLAFDGQKVKPVSLHDFKGKKQVALAFFVFAFTGG